MGTGKMVGPLLRLAAFVMVTIGVTVWLSFKIEKHNTNPRYELTAEFDDVTGLFPKDDVKLAGVVVGQVGSVKLQGPDCEEPCNPGAALVTFNVDKTYALPDDSQVVIRWRNLIGQRFLYLYAGKSNKNFEEGTRVPKKQTKGTVDLGQLINALGPLGNAINPNQINDIFQALNEALDGNEGNVTNLVKSLNSVVKTLADRSGTINQIIDDYNTITGTLAKRDDQIGIVVENLLTISQAVNDNTALVERALGNFATFSTNLATVLTGNEAALAATLDNLSVATDTIVGRLPELEGGLVNLGPAVQALFGGVNRGEFLTANVVCLDTDPAPCNTGIVLASAAPPSGFVTALHTPADFRSALVGA